MTWSFLELQAMSRDAHLSDTKPLLTLPTQTAHDLRDVCSLIFSLSPMFEYGYLFNLSAVKVLAQQPEIRRVYFIMACSDSRRVLATVAAALCVLVPLLYAGY